MLRSYSFSATYAFKMLGLKVVSYSTCTAWTDYLADGNSRVSLWVHGKPVGFGYKGLQGGGTLIGRTHNKTISDPQVPSTLQLAKAQRNFRIIQ